jgi:glycosyltransferase involved in cell wall biosynthesis
MARVAVIHRQLDVGGGESVCFHVLEALQADHDVHLFALNHPDLERLNETFGTNVTDVSIHTPKTLAKVLEFSDSVGRAITRGTVGVDTGLQLAALSRQYSTQWKSFDVRISTHGELPLSPPAIQYIHHPFLNRWDGGGHFEIQSTAGCLFNRFYTRLSGATPKKVRESELLTNSEWSADQIETLYGDRPDILFPPIDVEQLDGVPWDQRENGFVSIGRISRDKQSHRAIEILDRVRETGHDVHLHLIGPIDQNSSYATQIQNAAKNRSWLSIEGEVTQERLHALIQNHKWGIHTKPFEHFGMVVAEQVAAGTVPFVPNSGGQVDIVGRNSALCYESNDDAVTKITDCLSDEGRAIELRESLPDVRSRFGKERFEEEIKARVNSALTTKR